MGTRFKIARTTLSLKEAKQEKRRDIMDLALIKVDKVAELLGSNVGAINTWLWRNPELRDRLTRKAFGRRLFIKSELENYILNNGIID